MDDLVSEKLEVVTRLCTGAGEEFVAYMCGEILKNLRREMTVEVANDTGGVDKETLSDNVEATMDIDTPVEIVIGMNTDIDQESKIETALEEPNVDSESKHHHTEMEEKEIVIETKHRCIEMEEVKGVAEEKSKETHNVKACFCCGRKGHTKNVCRYRMLECKHCHKTGHTLDTCWKR